VEVNPYEAPDGHAAKHPTETRRGDTHRNLETAVAVTATMLLGGGWAGVRYQGSSFLVALGLSTLGILFAAIAYAVVAKRLGVLLFLPLFGLAVVAQELLAALFLLGGVVGFPITVLFSLFRSTRQNWIVAGQTALIAVTAIGSILLYSKLQSLGAQRAAHQGDEIVDAIHRYETLEGKLPNALEDLVPRELESIPDTGMIGFPSFQYIGPIDQTPQDEERLFKKYELRVNLYKLLQFDCLVYWPEGNYPRMMYGGGVEQIGSWAYVHE